MSNRPLIFVGDDGFRRVSCLRCGTVAPVTSLPDDTRWRYAWHPQRYGISGCVNSGRLISWEREEASRA